MSKFKFLPSSERNSAVPPPEPPLPLAASLARSAAESVPGRYTSEPPLPLAASLARSAFGRYRSLEPLRDPHPVGFEIAPLVTTERRPILPIVQNNLSAILQPLPVALPVQRPVPSVAPLAPSVYRSLRPLAEVSRTYKLFVSHGWEYADEYDGLVNLLRRSALRWSNLSIEKDNPVGPNPLLQRSNLRLIRELTTRIREADCVLILAGMYSKYSDWIQSEIELAQEFGKPIVGVRPRGQERIPWEVRVAVGNRMVNWSTDSIVAEIRAAVAP